MATNHLPDETLLRILSYLNPLSLCRTARVDRNFHRLCLDPSLWKVLDLSPYRPFATQSASVELLIRCSQLQEIRLGCRADNTSVALKALRLHRSRLAKVSVHFDRKDRRKQRAFLSGIEQSGTKSLRDLEMTGGGVDEKVLAGEMECLKDLTALRLEVSYSYDLLVAIAGSCRNLVVLALGRYSLEDRGLNVLVDGIKETIEELEIGASLCTERSLKSMVKCALLNRLRICWNRQNVAGNEIVLSGILGLPRLRSLTLTILDGHGLGMSSRAEDIFVAVLAGKRLGLVDLALPGMDWSEDMGVAIGDSCPELRSLDLVYNSVTCDGLRRLLMACRNLRHLKLGGIHDFSVASLVRALEDTTLQTLEGYWRWDGKEFEMMAVGKALPNLRIIR